jgi:RNA polymerase sigma-70 factor (ECF subfamily)
MGEAEVLVRSSGVAAVSSVGGQPSAPESQDPAAERTFARLWREYYRRLWVFVRAFGAMSSEEAEDAVQEIMWKLYRSLPQLDGARPSTPWVFRIARNHCIDRMRSRGSRLERDQEPLPEEGIPDGAPGPLEALVRSEDRAGVGRFMEAASPTDRQILYLAYFEHLRLREVAESLEMSEGTVKYRIHELKRRLRESVEEGA